MVNCVRLASNVDNSWWSRLHSTCSRGAGGCGQGMTDSPQKIPRVRAGPPIRAQALPSLRSARHAPRGLRTPSRARRAPGGPAAALAGPPAPPEAGAGGARPRPAGAATGASSAAAGARLNTHQQPLREARAPARLPRPRGAPPRRTQGAPPSGPCGAPAPPPADRTGPTHRGTYILAQSSDQRKSRVGEVRRRAPHPVRHFDGLPRPLSEGREAARLLGAVARWPGGGGGRLSATRCVPLLRPARNGAAGEAASAAHHSAAGRSESTAPHSSSGIQAPARSRLSAREGGPALACAADS